MNEGRMSMVEKIGGNFSGRKIEVKIGASGKVA